MTRTTLALSEDARLAARNLASREQISLGEAVSRLVIRGARHSADERLPVTGEFSQLGRRPGHTLTTADVQRLMDEEGI